MHLVAGCFANINNATRLVSKMKTLGFDAQLLQTGGLYKVSLASGFTAESLTAIQQKAKEASIDCWIPKPTTWMQHLFKVKAKQVRVGVFRDSPFLNRS